MRRRSQFRALPLLETARNPLSLACMSLIRILNYMPFARALVSPARDLEDEATLAAAMIFRALNLLAAVWGLMLLVSASVLVIIAWLAPGVAFFGSPGARDLEIHSIKSVTDAGLLQRKAILDVSESYATGATATFVCHIALWTLLFVIIASIGGLLLIRWMKRHLTPAEADNQRSF